MANQNQTQADQTLSSWGSLDRDVGSFEMDYREPSFPETRPKRYVIIKCAVYFPLSKMVHFPCRVRNQHRPAFRQVDEVLKVQLPMTNDMAQHVKNELGFFDERDGTIVYTSMVLKWHEIRHIVIRSANEVEIGFRREMMQGDTKLVIMTHHHNEVENFALEWLIERFAVTLRLPNDGPMGEMVFGVFFEVCEELEYWYRFGADPFTEVWQARKRTLFRMAHTLVDNEITGRTQNTQWLVDCFNQALGLYLEEAPDCSEPCWDDPRQLVDEEAVGYRPRRLQVPPVQSERVQFTHRPLNYEKECQVYLSYRACWYTITNICFKPNQRKLKFFYHEPGMPQEVLLFEFYMEHLTYWKEACIVDADHYALVLYSFCKYLYIRSANMANHLGLRARLMHTFGAHYPTVGDENNANDTLMSQLGTVPLVAYHRLWTNPGGVQPDQLFYRTVALKRIDHVKNQELVKHDMEQMACRMMDRYAFKLARALLRRDWNRTNADANVAPNEPRRILRQLALYKSLLPDMTKWFHHATQCDCDSCTQKENDLRAEHTRRADRDVRFRDETFRQDRHRFYFYRQKLQLDCRIKHAHFAEPDY